MAIRRQGYLFDFQDLGNLPIIRIDALSSRQQSVLVGLNINDGFGVLTKSLYTPADQFIVLEYVGSTPGGFQANELKGAESDRLSRRDSVDALRVARPALLVLRRQHVLAERQSLAAWDARGQHRPAVQLKVLERRGHDALDVVGLRGLRC